MQLKKLNNCYTEVNMELLLCVACLNPRELFCSFDKQKLIVLLYFTHLHTILFPFENNTCIKYGGTSTIIHNLKVEVLEDDLEEKDL